ncbi:hypothetical protein BJV82DRAFT_671512 [Fennellomyces sp. T-0311]|nr:hypothetical protein BJV82DRAFT_671512 [Fennellomyces sp. T-0311]
MNSHQTDDVPAPSTASTPATSTPTDADDTLQQKYTLLKKRVREIEEDNDAIHIKLTKAMRQIKRLRVERIVLLEELDNSRQYRRERKAAASDSEGSVSDSATKDHAMLKSAAPTKRKGTTKAKATSKQNQDAPARKKRDPNAPKGPGNVFFLYCRLERDNIKDQLSSDNLGEATRLLGQKWKALSKDEKKVYYDMYNKEQKEFEAAMELYNAAGGAATGANSEQSSQAPPQKDKEDDENIDMLHEDDEDDDQPQEEQHFDKPVDQPVTDAATPVPESSEAATHEAAVSTDALPPPAAPITATAPPPPSNENGTAQ